MNIPSNLLYTKTHEWVLFENDTTALTGITDYAQSELGDIVYVNLPEVGDSFTKGDSYSEVETVKAVEEIFTPLTGTVSEINEAVSADAEKISASPYDMWFVKFTDITDKEELLTAEQYEAYIKEL